MSFLPLRSREEQERPRIYTDRADQNKSGNQGQPRIQPMSRTRIKPESKATTDSVRARALRGLADW
jgi:hypothetical protein